MRTRTCTSLTSSCSSASANRSIWLFLSTLVKSEVPFASALALLRAHRRRGVRTQPVAPEPALPQLPRARLDALVRWAEQAHTLKVRQALDAAARARCRRVRGTRRRSGRDGERVSRRVVDAVGEVDFVREEVALGGREREDRSLQSRLSLVSLCRCARGERKGRTVSESRRRTLIPGTPWMILST